MTSICCALRSDRRVIGRSIEPIAEATPGRALGPRPRLWVVGRPDLGAGELPKNPSTCFRSVTNRHEFHTNCVETVEKRAISPHSSFGLNCPKSFTGKGSETRTRLGSETEE